MTKMRASGQGRDLLLQLLTGFVFLVGLAGVLQPALIPTVSQRIRFIGARLLDDSTPQGLQDARTLWKSLPRDPYLSCLVGILASKHSDHLLAQEAFSSLPADGGFWEFQKHFGLAQRFEIQGRIAEEEQELKAALKLDPWHLETHSRLGHLLQIEGRAWESAQHFLLLVRSGRCRGDELLVAASVERLFRTDPRLESRASARRPREQLIELAVARREIFEDRFQSAETRLRALLAEFPDLGEAQGRLGRILVDRGQLGEFLLWRGGLSQAAHAHPEVWYVLGLQSRRQGLMPGAAHCFLQTLKLSPNHLGATMQLAGVLKSLGKHEAARVFERRGQLLAELEGHLNLLRENADVELIRKSITLLGELGRYWEAAGWCFVLTNLEIPSAEPRQQLLHWLSKARELEQHQAGAFDSDPLLDLSEFPAPNWQLQAPSIPAPETVSPSGPAWAFDEDAERTGLNFRYFEGTQEENRLQHIFNVMGGGVGVIDFDLDGWPDLYFPQGHNWRDKRPQPVYIDRLFRNVLGRRFDDVTAGCRIVEVGFSHGATVGDYNQDGFPDLYIGNLGKNRLFQNLGDGTFEDVTDIANVGGNEWSTSSVLADFNGDSWPDLYVANYTLLQETADKECLRGGGEPIACTPDVLPAEHDRFYLNLGDGRFADVSETAGIRVPGGRGLGLIAWDYTGTGRLGIMVSNDTTGNFLFTNTGNTPDGVPVFVEEGTVRGVAYDVDGKAQASMGVAAGDPDGDGQIDLFVTNFVAEANAFYHQRSDGFFDDISRPKGLWEASFWMNGFGCQFADFNGDGWEDLLLANGHVDQKTSRGDSDRMPPQAFSNQNGKVFREVAAEKLGGFFQTGHLGRGLATLDWNRDGLMDAAVSHLHEPVALLTNRTNPVLRQIRLRLVGTRGAREPTGAKVRLLNPASPWTRLVTAGDGFLSTNQKLMTFPALHSNAELLVEVAWPSGAKESWKLNSLHQEVLLIEGNHLPYWLPGSAESPGFSREN